MILDREDLLKLETEYGVGFSTVIKCYTSLISVPCVECEGKNKLFSCLELLIQSGINNNFKQKEMEQSEESNDSKSFEYSLSDALYRIYEDDSLPYLCDEYKIENSLLSEIAL